MTYIIRIIPTINDEDVSAYFYGKVTYTPPNTDWYSGHTVDDIIWIESDYTEEENKFIKAYFDENIKTIEKDLIEEAINPEYNE